MRENETEEKDYFLRFATHVRMSHAVKRNRRVQGKGEKKTRVRRRHSEKIPKLISNDTG